MANTVNDLMIGIWSTKFDFIALTKRRNSFLTVFTHYSVVLWTNSRLVNWQELPLYRLLYNLFSPKILSFSTLL